MFEAIVVFIGLTKFDLFCMQNMHLSHQVNKKRGPDVRDVINDLGLADTTSAPACGCTWGSSRWASLPAARSVTFSPQSD